MSCYKYTYFAALHTPVLLILPFSLPSAGHGFSVRSFAGGGFSWSQFIMSAGAPWFLSISLRLVRIVFHWGESVQVFLYVLSLYNKLVFRCLIDFWAFNLNACVCACLWPFWLGRTESTRVSKRNDHLFLPDIIHSFWPNTVHSSFGMSRLRASRAMSGSSAVPIFRMFLLSAPFFFTLFLRKILNNQESSFLLLFRHFFFYFRTFFVFSKVENPRDDWLHGKPIFILLQK